MYLQILPEVSELIVYGKKNWYNIKFTFCLFSCHVPAVSSHWVLTSFLLSFHRTLSFRHVHSATPYKPVIQSKERRKDTTGGRSDAILTSNCKPSHSLFPIKSVCQWKEYKRGRARYEGGETYRNGRQTEKSELVEK